MKNEDILNVLVNPYCYEGLPNRKEHQILLKLLRFPALDAYYSWTVFAVDDLYYLRRIVLDQRSTMLSDKFPKTYGCEKKLSETRVKKIVIALQSIKLKPFLRYEGIVIDGVFHSVELGACRLQWNIGLQEELDEVQKWFDGTVAYFERVLPPCTLEYNS